MDEILFRSSQKLENLQIQLSLAASQSKDLLQQYSQQSKSAVLQAWNSSFSEQVKTKIQTLWQYIVSLGLKTKQHLWLHINLEKLYYNLAKVFWQKCIILHFFRHKINTEFSGTKRDVCFLCAGFVCGSIVGVIFVLSTKKKVPMGRYMQAVQCTNYLGVESVMVVETAQAPDECKDNEVIVSVKAASVHVVDVEICRGYGRILRKILQKIYMKRSKCGLPVTLGRDCSGIVTDIGSNVTRLEIGDEVWLTVPSWCEGTLSQNVIVPEFRIGKKPKNVGYEGACSLPYAGTLALNALKETEISKENAENKSLVHMGTIYPIKIHTLEHSPSWKLVINQYKFPRFLILDGCTPVGCILIQILKQWKANITTTCTKRAMPVAKALGAGDVITVPEVLKNETKSVLNVELPQECSNIFQKELELRDKFDFVIITKKCALDMEKIEKFCSGKLVSTLPRELYSDSCGLITGCIIQGFIYVKSIFEKLLGVPLNDYDEGHMCYVTLDELADMVERGILQTVVDKVLHPQDIEIALNHIQSCDSIGSTIITFR